jgi:hypothetical protein
MPAPILTFATEITATIGQPTILGPVAGGVRAVVPIVGGTLAGPLLSGEIVPGGADWALLQPDGTAYVDARYVIRLSDGGCVAIRNTGFCRPVEGSQILFTGHSQPSFEAPDGQHAWLNGAVFTCAFRSDLSEGIVRLRLSLMEGEGSAPN